MKQSEYLRRGIGVTGLLFSLVLFIYFSDIVLGFTSFGEKYLSPDNRFESSTVSSITRLVTFTILVILSLSFLMVLNVTKKTFRFFYTNSHIQTDEIKKFFFADDLCSKKRLSVYLLVIGTLFSLLLHVFILLSGEPTWEGTLEKYSSLLFLISSVIFLFSCTKVNRMPFSSKTRRKIIYSLLAMSGILLLIFGEEISWGQRIFGWNSFGFFNQYNYQNETNLHNFLNPVFRFIYPTVGMSSFIVLLFIWFFSKTDKPYLFNLFLPHPSLLFLIFIMACSSFQGSSEVYEELFGMFSALYSIRIFMCLNYPKPELNPVSQQTMERNY